MELLSKETGKTFKVNVKRADKSFPMSSYELACALGDYCLDHTAFTVDVHHPDVNLDVDVREEAAYLSCHDQAGQFLGEATLWNFSNDSGAEVGIRLKKEAQKHGYAQEAVKLLLDYAQNTLGLRYLIYESFLENAPSIALAKKMGFVDVYQDRLKRHFRKAL